MNEKEKIISKIKEKAYENVNKKLEEERKKVEDKTNFELKDVERCLQYIQNKMVFKIEGNNIYSNKYYLADENTFLKDYLTEPKYSFKKGIRFFDSSSKPYQPLFEVNGESYYDMRYIIRHYEERFNEYSRRLDDLRDKFNDIKEKANELIKQEPLIKKLIEQYKQVEIDETWKEKLLKDDY